MSHEDYKLIPLAALGLVRGIGEVIIKPFAMEQADRARHVASAAIYYFTNQEAHDAANTH